MKYKLILLVAVIVLTRLPFLFDGYGADGDAWRVAHVGYTLWTSGVYELSRPPGYPAHEILSAPLVALGGSVLSNAATLVASIIAVLLWHAFVRGRTQQPAMLTVAFAFAPLFWVNSAATMDYNWSLLMILLAMHAVLRARPISAGVMAGLAIGFRPTNAVLVVPLVILLMTVIRENAVSSYCERSPESGKEATPAKNEQLVRPRLVCLPVFLFAAFVTVVVVFLPVLLTYGLGGWADELRGQFGSSALGLNDAVMYFSYRTVYAIGPLAFLGVLWIVLQRRAFRAAWNSPNALFSASFAALCVLLLTFALFPLEKSYLLAGLPFLLLVLDRLATPRAFSLFTLGLISFAFVNPDVVLHDGARGSPGFNIHTGMVLEEWQKRKELGEWRDQLASVVVPERTVIMTGAGPIFWFENTAVEPVRDSWIRDVHDVVVQRRGDPSIVFVPMIPRVEADRLGQLGWRVLCDARNRDYIQRTMGYPVAVIPVQVRAR